jgi:hypothetical protein
VTSKSDEIAINSHTNINVPILEASGTIRSDITKSANRIDAPRERKPFTAYPILKMLEESPTRATTNTKTALNGSSRRSRPVSGSTDVV